MNRNREKNAETKFKTILLVDDNPSVLEVVSILLHEFGYTIIATSCPLKGITIASDSQQQIDLVLTDIDMPTMNGIQMVEQITAIRPGIRALFISGGHTFGLQNKHIDVQTNFIPKPLGYKVLQGKLKELFAE